MSNIEWLEQSKEAFSNLTSADKVFLKALERLEMIIRKTFGEKSHYLEKLSNIQFYSPIYFSGMENDYNTWFMSGKEQTIALIETMIEDLKLDSSSFKPPTQIINQNKNTKVFIVHGRDDLAKEQVARLLERLSLQAIILHEQNDSGQTIIEKLENNTDVGFAVVLYTACDVGKFKDDETLQSRARQNVIFEHGYLIARIGRKNVLALVKESVEIPSDIAGVVYTKMDSEGAWKYRLANELRSSNFDVDMNKI